MWRSGSVAVVYRGQGFDKGGDIPPLDLEMKLEGLISPQIWNMNAKSTSYGLSNTASHETSGVAEHTNADDQLSEDEIEGSTIKIPSTEVTGSSKQMDGAVPLRKLDTIPPPLDMVSPRCKHGDGTSDAVNIPAMEQNPRKSIDIHDPYIEREYEMEVEGILESLGPRYEEWKGLQPAPVDADLLPSEVPNYRPPYRLLPYGVDPKLTDHEQTNLRRLVRHINPHFALGFPSQNSFLLLLCLICATQNNSILENRKTMANTVLVDLTV